MKKPLVKNSLLKNMNMTVLSFIRNPWLRLKEGSTGKDLSSWQCGSEKMKNVRLGVLQRELIVHTWVTL